MDQETRLLWEKDRIRDTITQLFICTDQRDWAGVRATLADSILMDMTSVAGGEPSRMSSEQVASGWEHGLRSIEAIHHQVGNFRINLQGEQATAFCYGIASHYRTTSSGRNTRVFVGSYDFHLHLRGNRWRIESFRFNLKYLDGNRDLERD